MLLPTCLIVGSVADACTGAAAKEQVARVAAVMINAVNFLSREYLPFFLLRILYRSSSNYAICFLENIDKFNTKNLVKKEKRDEPAFDYSKYFSVWKHGI